MTVDSTVSCDRSYVWRPVFCWSRSSEDEPDGCCCCCCCGWQFSADSETILWPFSSRPSVRRTSCLTGPRRLPTVGSQRAYNRLLLSSLWVFWPFPAS